MGIWKAIKKFDERMMVRGYLMVAIALIEALLLLILIVALWGAKAK